MSRGNISSLGDLKKREEGNAGGASGGEPGDEYYSGGNDNRGGGSGLNVLDPNSDMDRLKAAASAQSSHSENAIKIIMYKNGLSMGDESFIPKDDPRFQQCMDDMSSGRIPVPLLGGKIPTGEVEVVVVDKREENYSIGVQLGKASPPSDGEGMLCLDDIDDCDVVVDASPSTLIQLKLANGRKLKLKLNQSHTVRDILRHIKKDGSTAGPFTLSAGFPPVALTDLNMTISGAKLIGASVTQTLI